MVSDIVLSLVEVIYSVLPVTGITTVSTNNSCLPPANDLKELSTTLSILSMMLTMFNQSNHGFHKQLLLVSG